MRLVFRENGQINNRAFRPTYGNQIAIDTRSHTALKNSCLKKRRSYRIIDNKCLLSYMKQIDLSIFDPIPYFTTEAVRQLVDEEKLADGTIETNLYRWVRTGRVIRLKKGMYMTRRFYEQYRSNESFSPMVSAILIPQSYLSLEYILQRHGVLTEVTFPVTSITIKQNRVIENATGTYSYRNIKNDLYAGFSISEYMGIRIARASLGKALFDFLYLRPILLKGLLKNRNLAEELRLDLSEVPDEDREVFRQYVEDSRSPKMERVYSNLRRTTWRH